jgi:5-methyltetrahydropteroyltriglutamate--homocysteine methyltransferase
MHRENAMEACGATLRAEVIGSLLRPRALKEAAAQNARGALSRAEADEVLAREVARVIARQEGLGFRVVTDGEFGRTSWFGFFFEGMQGFRLAPSLFQFKDAMGQAFTWQTCVAAGPIQRGASITLPAYERACRYSRSAMVKITIPAPSAFHFFRLEAATDPAVYPDHRHYFADLARVYASELQELAAAGCRYVQFDEVPLAMLCDPSVRQQAANQGADPNALLDTYIGLLAQICALRPAGMRLGLHLCRGNFRGRWMAAGGYEPIADKVFNGVPVDVFLLEYESERAGDFMPLRFVPRDKSVVLGLVSSKLERLEEEAELVRRIEAAGRILPLERLALSTQCGFASVAGGNPLSETCQWAKLELIARAAERIWGTT